MDSREQRLKIEAMVHRGTPEDIDRFARFCEAAWFGAKDVTGPGTIQDLTDAYIMTTGLAGEVGEVMELLKKEVRDGTPCKEQLTKEAGDVLYYLCMILKRHDIWPSEALVACREKIMGRLQRDTLRGSGDDR